MALHIEGPTGATRRLHNILFAFHALNLPAQGENRLFEVLPRVMKIEEADPNRRAMLAVGMLSDMFASVEREIEQVFPDEASRSFHKRPLTGLGSAFSPLHLPTYWTHLKVNLRDADLTGLEYTAHAIQLIKTEKLLSQTDLASIEKALQGAEEEIHSSHLGEEVKRLLIDALGQIKYAIHSYPLSGVEGMKRALFAYAGTIAFYKEVLTGDDEPSLRESIWNVVSRVSDVITIAQAGWIGYHGLLPVVSALQLLGTISTN